MTTDFKINDIVWFQAYEDNMGCLGRINRIGTKTELGMFFMAEDSTTHYELNSVVGNCSSFTRTSKDWISKDLRFFKKVNNVEFKVIKIDDGIVECHEVGNLNIKSYPIKLFLKDFNIKINHSKLGL